MVNAQTYAFFFYMSPLSILLFLLGIGVQIQLLFGATQSYMGLRLNLGDTLIPIAGLCVLTSLIRKKTIWPLWQRPCHDLWFYALCGSIAIGLLTAFIQYGTISHWALFNRGIGWAVLTGYIFFAGWAITNLSEKHFLIFMRAFIGFSFVTIILGTIWFFLSQLEYDQSNRAQGYIQFSGLMGNRNAFAFLMLCSVTIYTYFDCNKINLNLKIQPYITSLIWFFLPLAMIFNGSRAGWIGTGLIVFWFFLSQFKYSLRFILPTLMLSCVAISTMYIDNSKSVFRESQDSSLSHLGEAQTDSLRLIVGKDAMDLWSNHKVFGAGLGGFLIYQEKKHGKVLDQIDNSALWVLTELGLVGALLFGSFYCIALLSLWRISQKKLGTHSIFAQSMMVIIILFALFSLVHQILYARYLWFLLGLALAMPQDRNIKTDE